MKSKIVYSEDIKPGDIIREVTSSGTELARYLVIDRFFEEDIIGDEEKRTITYFESVLIYVNSIGDGAIWYRNPKL